MLNPPDAERIREIHRNYAHHTTNCRCSTCVLSVELDTLLAEKERLRSLIVRAYEAPGDALSPPPEPEKGDD